MRKDDRGYYRRGTGDLRRWCRRVGVSRVDTSTSGAGVGKTTGWVEAGSERVEEATRCGKWCGHTGEEVGEDEETIGTKAEKSGSDNGAWGESDGGETG